MKTEGLIWRSMDNNEVFCNFVNRPEFRLHAIFAVSDAIRRPKKRFRRFQMTRRVERGACDEFLWLIC